MNKCINCGVDFKPKKYNHIICDKKCRNKYINKRLRDNPSYREKEKQYRLQTKLKCINHYSNNQARCFCCGEANILFLTLDHTKNNGAEHRKEIKGGFAMQRWIIQNNFPSGFQVLCWNCNCGRSINNGVCPHLSPRN